ncbi:unnamed protein product [Durusdinium trenchii]|uniref:Uncharacterized protein n=2 Tax=Durusdinium trenchii TaxID=1381693 RepID=A0ABP0JVK6_9DINO
MKARFVLLLCGVAVAETGVQIFPKLERLEPLRRLQASSGIPSACMSACPDLNRIVVESLQILTEAIEMVASGQNTTAKEGEWERMQCAWTAELECVVRTSACEPIMADAADGGMNFGQVTANLTSMKATCVEQGHPTDFSSLAYATNIGCSLLMGLAVLYS